MESLFTQKLTNKMQMKKERRYDTIWTFPQSFKKNSFSGSAHLLGLQKYQYHPDCVKQMKDKPKVIEHTMLRLLIPSDIPPQYQVSFLKDLRLGFLVKI
jgi:hypothetical protein